jgi:hypothetical protein
MPIKAEANEARGNIRINIKHYQTHCALSDPFYISPLTTPNGLMIEILHPHKLGSNHGIMQTLISTLLDVQTSIHWGTQLADYLCKKSEMNLVVASRIMPRQR